MTNFPIIKVLQKLFVLAIIIGLPQLAFAQGLTLQSGSPTQSILPESSGAWSLVVLRLALAIALFFSAFIAYKSGFNWLYWEGNAAKAKDAKLILSNALLVATGIFLVLSIMAAILDYSILGI
jgi:hypothetical protein